MATKLPDYIMRAGELDKLKVDAKTLELKKLMSTYYFAIEKAQENFRKGMLKIYKNKSLPLKKKKA